MSILARKVELLVAQTVRASLKTIPSNVSAIRVTSKFTQKAEKRVSTSTNVKLVFTLAISMLNVLMKLGRTLASATLVMKEMVGIVDDPPAVKTSVVGKTLFVWKRDPRTVNV